MEKEHMLDNIEVYVRSETPSAPLMIYSTNKKGNYSCAREAIIEGRKMDYQNALSYYKGGFTPFKDSLVNLTNKEEEILNQIHNLAN